MGVDRLWLGARDVTKPYGISATVAFVTGGLLIIWSSYIHFHLWQKVGYRHIPTIGPLFAVQAIAGVVVGILIIIIRRVWVAIVGAGFAMSTLIGFLISVEHGLFGFKDAWSSPFAHQAFIVEIATIVVLTVSMTICLIGTKRRNRATNAPVRFQS